MELLGDGFSITSNDNTLFFNGNIELQDYTEISQFLEGFSRQLGENIIRIDLTNLDFFNSGGIRTLAIFFMSVFQKIEVLIKDVTWQKIGITPLGKLKPKKQIVISVAPK